MFRFIATLVVVLAISVACFTSAARLNTDIDNQQQVALFRQSFLNESLRHGNPCPHKDSHPFKCALAITECAVECVVGDKKNTNSHSVALPKKEKDVTFDPIACVKCIAEKVGEHDLHMCCQTLSYHFHFGCSVCDHI